MKARLTKNLKVKSVTTYLVIEIEQERKDIQAFLNDKKFKDDDINQRVYEYLRSIRVLDENNLPTQKGEKIKKTGKIPVKQEGKYRVWFIEDNFLGKKILHFKRIEPKKENNLSKLEISFDKENHYYLPLDETNNEKQPEEFFIFNVLNGNENKPYEEYNNSIDITLTWMWEEFEKSYLIFTGNLVSYQAEQKNGNQFYQKLKPVEIPYKYDLEKCIQEILTDWDYKFKKYKIRFEELKDDNEKKHFEKNITIQNGWKNFDIQFEKVPLMPYDNENAEKWRNWLVTQELEKNYFNRNDFSELVKEINQKPALEPFHLSSIKPFEFLKIIGKSENPKPYWHLMATLDLNPSSHMKHYSLIQFSKNEQISFQDIAQKLKAGIIENSNDSFTFVYYDRFLIKELQQKKAIALINAIQAKKIVIITNLEYSESSLLQNNKQIELINLKQVFKQEKPAHDRYLIFIDSQNIYVWNCSNSIDYINFQEPDFDEKTVGVIKESVVFTRISKEILDNNLLNFVKTKL